MDNHATRMDGPVPSSDHYRAAYIPPPTHNSVRKEQQQHKKGPTIRQYDQWSETNELIEYGRLLTNNLFSIV
ncbi:hypothetical protein BLOT_003268 [Blomia tropicalis]|nr:hypothetical protein BLOT_003268 [Blomia tropicalis]